MSIVGESSKSSNSEITLQFGDPDLEGLKLIQDDPLVITPIIRNCPVMRVLVDNAASVDIQFHDTFPKVGYNYSQLTPSNAPIYGFNQVECQVEGAIQLPVTIGEDPSEATKMLNFHIVKAKQKEIRKWPAVAILQHLGPMELGADPEKVTYVGASLNKPLKGQMITFLQENINVFSWTVSNMSEIDTNLITHKLNVDPTRKAMKQKKRTYAPNRLEAIKQEVEKLLKA
ncbi:uncharacterized protein LOC141700722 [Apium graveolens]|uniref:uncharacterized protein LOC141700722 n=1 Tax=Apium graveolens TaxID=4045 RepID=UPI003D791941